MSSDFWLNVFEIQYNDRIEDPSMSVSSKSDVQVLYFKLIYIFSFSDFPLLSTIIRLREPLYCQFIKMLRTWCRITLHIT